MGEAIEKLAHFVATTSWETIPESVREHAKLVLLDTVGVILAGSVQPEVSGARGRRTATGGRGATVYAPPWPTTDPRTAALLNGLAGRSIELCEGHRYVSSQAAVQVLPHARASDEWLEGAGRNTFAARIVGYDVAVRLGAAMTARPIAHQNGQAPLLGGVAAGARPRGVAGGQMSVSLPGGRPRAERRGRDEWLRRRAGARIGPGRRDRTAECHRGGLRPLGRRRIPS